MRELRGRGPGAPPSALASSSSGPSALTLLGGRYEVSLPNEGDERASLTSLEGRDVALEREVAVLVARGPEAALLLRAARAAAKRPRGAERAVLELGEHEGRSYCVLDAREGPAPPSLAALLERPSAPLASERPMSAGELGVSPEARRARVLLGLVAVLALSLLVARAARRPLPPAPARLAPWLEQHLEPARAAARRP